MTEAPLVVRTAQCRCGQLQAVCEGEPVRVSVCHCLACQRRSGSAFTVQARFPSERVTVTGETQVWSQTGDEGGVGTFRFCPQCGSTVIYEIDAMPGLIAVAVGAFADPTFPPPRFSIYEERRHPWAAVLGAAVTRD